MTRRVRWRWAVAAMASLALLGCLLLGLHDARAILLSYLAAWIFWLAPALGSVALLMVHALTGGDWGEELRPVLLSAARLLPLLAVLALPFVCLATLLYPWAHPQALHGLLDDPHLQRQRWYLNLPFFIVRAVVCLGAWVVLGWALRRRLRAPARPPMTALAAIGLIVYAITITVAATDWVMSLVPIWHSSAFGITLATSQMLCAAAVATLVAADAIAARDPRRAGDLGMLLMALLLAWAYLMFMDYLTAWIADQPAETTWYLPRVRHAWAAVAWGLVVVHLVLPFTLLLSRRAKRRAAGLRVAAGLLLLGQLGWVAWLVLPSFRPLGSPWMLSDALALLGIGGWCWTVFDIRLAATREVRA